MQQITIPLAAQYLPSVLCLNSLQFNRDIEALQVWSTRYAWPVVNDVFLVETQSRWMPRRAQEQGSYVNETGADMDAAWEKSKRFGLKIMNSVLKQGVRLKAVLSGNWDYWNEECIRLACAELGIPFLVLMREHDLTGIRKKLADEFYGPFKRIPDVAGVAGAGEASRDLLHEMNFFTPAKIRVTGWPRHDIWRTPVTPAYDRPVVLMSYHKGYNAAEDFEEMMVWFAALAKRYPHIPFIVKAKHRLDVQVLSGIAAARGLDLNIIDTGSLPSVLANARVLIGFNSAAMYEALLAPVPIVIPRWGQTDQNPLATAPSPTDPHLLGHMEFIRTPAAFEESVVRHIEAGPPALDMAARAAVFNHYFLHTPDRTQVERVEDFVAEFALP